MAEKLGEAQASISPNDFTSTVGELIAATVKKDGSVAKMRTVRARLEKAGANMRALDFIMRFRKLEGDEAAILLRDIVRYAGWLGLDAVKQGDLFVSDDAGQPNEQVRSGLTEAQTYEEGFAAGKAGRDAGDHSYMPGTPLHEKFYEGWCDGQAAIADEMGPKQAKKAGARRKRGADAGRMGV